MELEPINIKQVTMDRAGATREAGWRTVVDGLSANKIMVDKYGEEHVEADSTTRIKSAEIILKAVGDIRPEMVVDNRQVNIGMSGVRKEDILELMAMASDVKKQIEGLKGSGRQTGEIRTSEVIDI